MCEIEETTFPDLRNQNDSQWYESGNQTGSDRREDRLDIRVGELRVDYISGSEEGDWE